MRERRYILVEGKVETKWKKQRQREREKYCAVSYVCYNNYPLLVPSSLLIQAAKVNPLSVRSGTRPVATSMEELWKRRAALPLPSLPGEGVTSAPRTPTSAGRNGVGEKMENWQVLSQVASIQFGKSDSVESVVY